MSELRGQADDGGELHAEDVSRTYRLAAREEPSPELDAAIHAAALRAAGSRPRSLTRTPPRSWGVAIAVAATIVIGVSVAFLAVDRPDSMLAPVAEAPAPPPRESKHSAPVPGAPPASAEATSGDSAREASQAAPGAAGGQSSVTAAAREARPSRERTTRDELVPRREQPASPSAAPEPATPDAVRKAPSGAAQQAPRPPAVPDAAKEMPKSAPGADAQAGEEAELLSPEVWLQRIRELRDKGELAQADQSLRAFRRRYPGYPLPADVPVPAQTGK